MSLFEIPEKLLHHRHDNIYTISASNYSILHTLYKKHPLPDDILFPWLHGVDGVINQQNLFFGIRRSLAPNYRGLLAVHCGAQATASRLVESVLPTQVLDSHDMFYSNPETSINLRNFQNQIARFATLCDVVCYGQHAQQVAQLISKAQARLFEQRQQQLEHVHKTAGKRAVMNANTLQYKTVIVEDEFIVFEKEYRELVMYDTIGFKVNNVNFYELESQEMIQMTQASEITPHVYLGNTQDAPRMTKDDSSLSDFDSDSDDNPHQFSICIESHDLAEMPLPSTLLLAKETLNDCTDIIHFDMYSTGVPLETDEFNRFYANLIHLLNFITDQVVQQRNILIHCTDGYTETSLFAIIWIMFDQQLSLPEAYLYLQQKRSFFVYATDIPALRRIEQLLLKQDDEIVEPQRKRRKSIQEFLSSSEDQVEMVIDHPPKKVLLDDQWLNQVSNTPTGNVYRQLQLSPTPQEAAAYPWFFSPRFEGSFPSRILPFLYLGNLNHATNPHMLKALGITHVVSVGENADLKKQDFELLYLDNLYDDGIDSIRKRADQAISFVEDARATNGICLIHCRVGVSRSAAITICYVMKHMQCTLVQAYLFVRARRLNVIIQPNLKFMYELLQLEQSQTSQVTINWPVLCQEIYNLNFAYRDVSPAAEVE